MSGRLDRYLMREALLGMLAVSGVLWLAMMANIGVQLFSTVMHGALPVQILPGLLWANGVKLLLFVLPIGGFLGLLLAFGRLYRDQEIPVLLACGASPLRLMRPILAVTLPWALMIAWLALVQWPATQSARDTMLQQARTATLYERLPIGRFLVANQGRVTIYAERLAQDGRTLEEVFVHTRLSHGEGVERARRARLIEDEDGVRQLVLEDGRRYDGVIGQGDWRVISFAEHRIDLGLERRATAEQRKRSAQGSLELWQTGQAADHAELIKRAAHPISALLLALLALPLARAAPRQGRLARLGVGILVYVAYYNLITLGTKLVEAGRLDAMLGFMLPHLVLLVLIGVLYWRHGAFVRMRGRAEHAAA
ncbi:MAG: LPS export ABC transporter permease LptF [Halothiobacillaceae bacterium]